jgi:hypothetical protein
MRIRTPLSTAVFLRFSMAISGFLGARAQDQRRLSSERKLTSKQTIVTDAK